jgi:hypothetical protein
MSFPTGDAHPPYRLAGIGGPRSLFLSRRFALKPVADHSTNSYAETGDELSSRSADLIARAMPFDPASLEHAVDLFFEQFDSLDAEMVAGRGPLRLVCLSLAVAGTFAVVEFVRRQTAKGGVQGWASSVRNDIAGFPEVPGC